MTGGVRPDYRLIIIVRNRTGIESSRSVPQCFTNSFICPPLPTYTVILLDLHRTISMLEEIYEAEEGRVD